MDFLCTEKLFIANLLQFFPEFNRNMGKDDVIDKSLGFQNAFDSLSILVQLCTCDVGDTAGSKMNHWLTMVVLIFWCSQDDSCPVYPCKYMVAPIIGFQQNRIFLNCSKHKAIPSGPGVFITAIWESQISTLCSSKEFLSPCMSWGLTALSRNSPLVPQALHFQ